MAIDAYVVFYNEQNTALKAESQVRISDDAKEEVLSKGLGKGGSGSMKALAAADSLFEIEDYSFDIEQTLNLGSQSSGTGAGRIAFNPFSITRKIDRSSPEFFIRACNGTSFPFVHLLLRKSTGQAGAGQVFLRFDFRLVAVKTLSWSHDDESPKETVTFEYGALGIRYKMQKPDGSLDDGTPFDKSWNKVRNIEDTSMMIGNKTILGE